MIHNKLSSRISNQLSNLKYFPDSKRSSRISNQLSNLKYFPDSKRSQGHIEMILSFVLFLGAVLFIFFYINPFSSTKDNSDEVNRIQDTIIHRISANVGRLSIISSSGCYNFDSLDYTNITSNTKFVEVNESLPGGKAQYTIYFGEPDVFPNDIVNNNPSCDPSTYRLGVFSNQTILSYQRLYAITKGAVNDAGENIVGSSYEDVRRDLGVSKDFMIKTTDISGNPIPQLSFSRNIPGTVEVRSIELPMVLINRTGYANQIMFNLKVW